MAVQHAMNAADQGQDATMLVRSFERIFRYVARLLVGKITFRRANAVFREVFVQEAEARLRNERPGKNVPLSKLALLTGLDTRTLIRIRAELANRQREGDKSLRIHELSTEARVVEMWAAHPDFRDEKTGKPRTLSYNHPGSEFEAMARRVITARGVTVQTVLERLLATNSVEADRDRGELRLLTERYTPFDTEDEQSLLSIGLQAIINLTGTVCDNVHAAQGERLIQRELWTYRLDESRRDEFRDTVRAFLVRVEDDAESFMAPMESEIAYGEQITAGIGFYYFEEGYGSR